MGERRATSIVFGWLAKLVGYRDQRELSQAPANRFVLGITPEEVRRASTAVSINDELWR